MRQPLDGLIPLDDDFIEELFPRDDIEKILVVDVNNNKKANSCVMHWYWWIYLLCVSVN